MLPLPKFLLFLLLLAPLCQGQELRGMWADAFHDGMRSASQVTQMVADARAGKFNALFVQVRKRGDAYYSNGLEPRATDITGGASFDPLADLITKARTGGARIEVHAWIVTYNIWNQQSTLPSQTTHPYRLHPDWLTQKQDGTLWDGSNYAFDPGHPEVQEHTFNVCQDLLTRYNLDGLHFDYIRYTDSGSSVGNQPFGYNPVAVQRFQKRYNRTSVPAATDLQWLQFRRDQVTALVRKVYLNAWKTRPAARISAALISYGNAPTDSSQDSWQARDAYGRTLQDWRSWMQEGILDLSMPMIYRSYETAVASFAGWSNYAKDNQFGRATAPGVGFYLNTTADNISQIQQVRTASASGKMATGVTGYSYKVPTDDGTTLPAFYSQLTEPGGVFQNAATPPTMPWKTDTTKGHLMGYVRDATGTVDFDGAVISLTGPAARTLVSDATGFYGAVDLPVGTYQLTINVPGYYAITRSVTVGGATVAEAALLLVELPLTITASNWDRVQRRMAMTWNSKPGKSYRVEASTDLQIWAQLGQNVASAGYVTSYTTPMQPEDGGRQFFRVVEL